MNSLASDHGNERSLFTALTGRYFVNPAFDYLLIAGGLSLVVAAAAYLFDVQYRIADEFGRPTARFWYLVALANSAHFGASTVRLYSKPGATRSLPLLSWGLPVVALGLLVLCMNWPESWGSNLTSLYLTWSPYHYAAQAYGLAVMYSYRSGCLLGAGNKTMLWWVAMIPCFFNILIVKNAGLDWIIGGFVFLLHQIGFPVVEHFSLSEQFTLTAVRTIQVVASIGGMSAIAYLMWRVSRSREGAMPLIVAVLLFINGVWWFVLAQQPLQAFLWASVFHSVQYMAIVIIFHVKDQVPDNETSLGSVFFHIVWFYTASAMLGWALFQWLPYVYMCAGFNMAVSFAMVTAAINLHHFIVDGYIWRLKKSDSNRQIVDAGSVVPG
ncbi:MAG: hypothetical protein CMJ81_11840 [Planctomycetaceae bacterium]|jgi:hypothetical protein|nr:hypothetical protein [Planctomycetaceae bacterium]MBP60649.1 hypothetical protein [Planctomycetaceae bacterium]